MLVGSHRQLSSIFKLSTETKKKELAGKTLTQSRTNGINPSEGMDGWIVNKKKEKVHFSFMSSQPVSDEKNQKPGKVRHRKTDSPIHSRLRERGRLALLHTLSLGNR